MQFRVFQYPLPGDSELEDLNDFLRQHRVASVHREVVMTGNGALLVFVVEVTGELRLAGARNAARMDYRELLAPEDFEVFRLLREQRKRIAEAEGVPVYSVFTNAQLAEMVQRRYATSAELARIEGVGPARIEEYGTAMLSVLSAAGRERAQ